MSNAKALSFTTLMASSVHDMKNILGAVLESVDWLTAEQAKLALDTDHQQEFAKITRLVTHVNTELMQLLCLYKFENEQYSLNLREQEVADFLELQTAFLTALIKDSGFELEVICDEELVWPFDEVLLATAIRNAGMNALKFARQKIIIAAELVDNYLKISIEDDGAGFPPELLERMQSSQADAAAHAKTGVDLASGSTGLGLHFSKMAAAMHRGMDDQKKRGYVELANNSRLGGASIAIYLP